MTAEHGARAAEACQCYTVSSDMIRKENVSYITNISDITTQSYTISLAPRLAEIAYLAVLFILHLMHTTSSIIQLKNK